MPATPLLSQSDFHKKCTISAYLDGRTPERSGGSYLGVFDRYCGTKNKLIPVRFELSLSVSHICQY